MRVCYDVYILERFAVKENNGNGLNVILLVFLCK